MYDYDATGSDEISFKAGDKIKVLNRIPNGVDDGWWKGMVKSTGKVGLFPSIICEHLEESDSDEKTEDSLESPLSSCAPPSMAPPRTPDPSSSAAGNVETRNHDFHSFSLRSRVAFLRFSSQYATTTFATGTSTHSDEK